MARRPCAARSGSLRLFPLKKNADADAGTADGGAVGASPAAPASAATAAAANENAIARYPDEKPDRKDSTINFTVAGVTEAAGGGKTFVHLKKGTAVSQIAERGKFTLVTFADPKDPSRTLMGWVSAAVFGPEATKAVVRSGNCKPGQQTVQVMRTDGTGQFEDQCQHVCSSSKDCAAGTVCEGAGLDANGNGDLSFCLKGEAAPACGPGDSLIHVSGSPDRCAHVCARAGVPDILDMDDSQCPTGFACSAKGVDLHPPFGVGDAVGFCVKGKRAPDPGAATTTTASAAPKTPPAAKVKCVLSSPPSVRRASRAEPEGALPASVPDRRLWRVRRDLPEGLLRRTGL